MRIGWLVENDAAFVSDEVAALRRLGHRIEVASVFRPGSRWAEAFAGPVWYPEPGRGRWAVRGLAATARAPRSLGEVSRRARAEGAPLRLVVLAAELAERARRERWDHVHGSFATYPAWTAWAVGHLAGLPFSFTGHAYDVQHPRPWLPRLIGEAAFVRAISVETEQRLLALAESPGDACSVLVGHLGVDITDFVATPRRAPVCPEILAVARLVPKKGFEILVAAAARLAREGHEFRVRILGDGPLRSRLERQVSAQGLAGRVWLEGHADRARVTRALAEAAIFALPCVVDESGEHDGLPVALLEAMACGLPAVTTPVGGIQDAVVHGRNGLLVPPRDPRALADALASLLVDPGLRRRLGAAARATVRSDFRLEGAARRLAGWMEHSAPSAGAPGS